MGATQVEATDTTAPLSTSQRRPRRVEADLTRLLVDRRTGLSCVEIGAWVFALLRRENFVLRCVCVIGAACAMGAKKVFPLRCKSDMTRSRRGSCFGYQMKALSTAPTNGASQRLPRRIM